jgi:hypothetical protein
MGIILNGKVVPLITSFAWWGCNYLKNTKQKSYSGYEIEGPLGKFPPGPLANLSVTMIV